MRGYPRRGFTMIEVLTVVGVVVTLAGAVMSMLGTSKGRAKVVRCATNLDQIGKSVMLYVADYDDSIPPFLNFAADKGVMLTPESHSPWQASLMPYTKSSSVFFCTDDPFAMVHKGLEDVSRVDHRTTSYAHSEWLRRHTFNDLLQLNYSQVENPTTASYLEDDFVGVGRDRVPTTAHDDRPNFLFLDGHVKQAKARTSEAK
ncbi:MAG TPA: prepilin-type N-terminal cleavage/methylation domain-containing protein [Fimbriimonas sp.]